MTRPVPFHFCWWTSCLQSFWKWKTSECVYKHSAKRAPATESPPTAVCSSICLSQGERRPASWRCNHQPAKGQRGLWSDGDYSSFALIKGSLSKCTTLWKNVECLFIFKMCPSTSTLQGEPAENSGPIKRQRNDSLVMTHDTTLVYCVWRFKSLNATSGLSLERQIKSSWWVERAVQEHIWSFTVIKVNVFCPCDCVWSHLCDFFNHVSDECVRLNSS